MRTSEGFIRKAKSIRSQSRQNIYLTRLINAVAIGMVLVGTSVLTGNIANAQSLQDKINNLEKQNANNQSTVNKLKEVATSYQSAIEILEHDIAETQKSISVSVDRQHQLEVNIVDAENELAKQKNLLGQNIRAMYIEGDMSTIEMLASSNNLSEYIDKQQYREAVKKKITATLAKIEELKTQLETQKTQVETEIKEQSDSKAQLAIARAEQSRLLSLNQSQQTDYNEQTKANEAKIAEFKAEQERQAREMFSGNIKSQGSVKRGDVLGRVGSTGLSTGPHLHLEAITGPSCGFTDPMYYINSGQWLRPVEGGYISQYFNKTTADVAYTCGYHPGVDIAGVSGRPIRAVDDGEIVINCRGYCGGYGNTIVIQHSNGLRSRYAHML